MEKSDSLQTFAVDWARLRILDPDRITVPTMIPAWRHALPRRYTRDRASAP